ncbi:MAG: sialate O-acetylesterase [Bryobacteraceae bacterium]
MKLALAALLFTASASANPTLPPLFGNHMVLQQGGEVPVWGWADPQERITVSILDQARQTTTDAAGRWHLTILAPPAGGPYRLTVQGNRTVVFDDVLVGEVWICSGQSNMAFALAGAATAAEDIPDSDYAGIRLFQVQSRSVLQPLETTPDAAWRQLTPDSARNFSAVGYLFARRLHKALGVPVGMIQSTWSGTQAEVWTSPAALAASPELQPILKSWDAANPGVRALADHPAEFQLDFDGFELVRVDGSTEPLHPEWSFNWGDVRNSRFELALSGRAAPGLAAHLAGGIEADESPTLTGSLARRHMVRDLSQYSGLRFYCRGRGVYRFDVLEPAVYDSDEYRIPAIEATADWQPVTIRFADLKQAGWGVREPFTPAALRGFQILPQRAAAGASLAPGSLFNGMIAPLAPYAFRGAIWYQGEGNAGRAYQYRTLLPALIGSWRQAWRRGDFPFLIVQLPEFKPRRDAPSESDWAELREAQFLTLKNAPNTGLAVALGLGDAGNVHPHRKAEVAERLALWALGTTYGRAGEFSGPLFDSARIEAGAIRLSFQHTGGGLTVSSGSVPRGFAIAAADRKFHWADARLEGNEVVVSSPEVPAPVAVRYAWADNPDANLANGAGLPASPFRTDDWPGLTAPRAVAR